MAHTDHLGQIRDVVCSVGVGIAQFAHRFANNLKIALHCTTK